MGKGKDQKESVPLPSLPQHSSPVIEMQPSVSTAPSQPNAPVPAGWLPPSTTYVPDLQCLMELESLFVQPTFDLLQIFTGRDIENRYVVTDIGGEPVFYVAIEASVFSQLILCKKPTFEFIVYDRYRHQQILRMIRLLDISCNCSCEGPVAVLEVYSGDTLLGSVTQEWNCCQRIFYIRDASGQPVLMLEDITGFGRRKIKVESIDGNHSVGMIQQQSDGKWFSLSIKLEINFPRDLDVKIKALLLAACVFIDVLNQERRNRS